MLSRRRWTGLEPALQGLRPLFYQGVDQVATELPPPCKEAGGVPGRFVSGGFSQTSSAASFPDSTQPAWWKAMAAGSTRCRPDTTNLPWTCPEP